MHGGHVDAYSDGSGKGSRFVVTLSLSGEATDQRTDGPPSESLKPTRPLSVMVVDDNVDAAQMLSTILELHGHTVTVIERPSAALDILRQKSYDLLVLDIGLPEMDGYELARRIRSMPETSNACLVALSGYGQAQDKMLSRAAGFQHHLVKPINIKDLNALLSRFGGAGS
jgi:CheY-like chemotaxis protein